MSNMTWFLTICCAIIVRYGYGERAQGSGSNYDQLTIECRNDALAIDYPNLISVNKLSLQIASCSLASIQLPKLHSIGQFELKLVSVTVASFPLPSLRIVNTLDIDISNGVLANNVFPALQTVGTLQIKSRSTQLANFLRLSALQTANLISIDIRNGNLNNFQLPALRNVGYFDFDVFKAQADNIYIPVLNHSNQFAIHANQATINTFHVGSLDSPIHSINQLDVTCTTRSACNNIKFFCMVPECGAGDGITQDGVDVNVHVEEDVFLASTTPSSSTTSTDTSATTFLHEHDGQVPIGEGAYDIATTVTLRDVATDVSVDDIQDALADALAVMLGSYIVAPDEFVVRLFGPPSGEDTNTMTVGISVRADDGSADAIQCAMNTMVERDILRKFLTRIANTQISVIEQTDLIPCRACMAVADCKTNPPTIRPPAEASTSEKKSNAGPVVGGILSGLVAMGALIVVYVHVSKQHTKLDSPNDPVALNNMSTVRRRIQREGEYMVPIPCSDPPNYYDSAEDNKVRSTQDRNDSLYSEIGPAESQIRYEEPRSAGMQCHNVDNIEAPAYDPATGTASPTHQQEEIYEEARLDPSVGASYDNQGQAEPVHYNEVTRRDPTGHCDAAYRKTVYYNEAMQAQQPVYQNAPVQDQPVYTDAAQEQPVYYAEAAPQPVYYNVAEREEHDYEDATGEEQPDYDTMSNMDRRRSSVLSLRVARTSIA